ncbi:MAG TPA: M50 family metallopeptidase [Candidatus Limnocylindrales bacterium]|nr:M50 family metallopeptidase [Candidatus Limnocylindrales bacterium]
MPDLFVGLGNGLIDVVLLLVILVGLVVIHELGHFVAARRAGVTVHEFGIGFPPRAKVMGKDKHGTLYTLNWLPIGGFVRLEGEEGESDDPHAFIRQRLPTRLVILLAGVAMNAVLAFVLLTLITALADPSSAVRVLSVQDGSPAQTMGLRGGVQTGTTSDSQGNAIPIYDNSGDLILAVDGVKSAWFDLPNGPQGLTLYVRSRPATPVTLTVERGGQIVELTGTTRTAAEIAENKGPLGFTPQYEPGPTISRDPVQAVQIGAQRTLDAATLILRALGDFINNLASPPVSGPVGIVQAIGTVRTEAPPVFLVYFIALLSANLAVVNVLPLPPLDGGRVAVSLVRALVGERISLAAERFVYFAGFVFLMALLAWVTLFDTGILQRT